MHTTSDIYKQILSSGAYTVGVKLDIAGTEYTEANIVSVRITGGVFDSAGIGNTASREADIEILPLGEIPRQAKIQVFARLVASDGVTVSEWIPKGVFFISTRKKNNVSGALTITAYDAMLKAEEIWLDDSHAPASWPMPQADAVSDIAEKMGVGVDSRTVLGTKYGVEFPVDEEGEYSMREVLGQIAVANAGNWIISDEGNLLLLRFGGIPEETNYLVTESGDAITFGGVRILV